MGDDLLEGRDGTGSTGARPGAGCGLTHPRAPSTRTRTSTGGLGRGSAAQQVGDRRGPAPHRGYHEGAEECGGQVRRAASGGLRRTSTPRTQRVVGLHPGGSSGRRRPGRVAGGHRGVVVRAGSSGAIGAVAAMTTGPWGRYRCHRPSRGGGWAIGAIRGQGAAIGTAVGHPAPVSQRKSAHHLAGADRRTMGRSAQLPAESTSSHGHGHRRRSRSGAQNGPTRRSRPRRRRCPIGRCRHHAPGHRRPARPGPRTRGIAAPAPRDSGHVHVGPRSPRCLAFVVVRRPGGVRLPYDMRG